MGWEVGGRVKTEGTWVNLWLIRVGVWQKPIQYCKANCPSIKKKSFKLKINSCGARAEFLQGT